MKRFLIIDGNSLLHRAYHGYPPLSTTSGELVGAVYGFTTMLLGCLDKLKPEYLVVTWDVGKKTFRHDSFAEYKAGRPEMDQELVGQIARTKEVVEVLNIPQYGIENFEADDLIGTISKKVVRDHKEINVAILTGDRDELQLVEGDRIVVYMPSLSGYGRSQKDRGMLVYDENAVIAKYGLKPLQIIELKALMGDASDNIKGVKGVGQVTATKLLMQYGSIDFIYEKIDEIEATKRVRELLVAGKESAFLSRQLATIKLDVPVEIDLEKSKLSNYDKEAAEKLFLELEFKSLITKLPMDNFESEVEEVFR